MSMTMTAKFSNRQACVALLTFCLSANSSFAWVNNQISVNGAVQQQQRNKTPPANVKLLILPGFGNDREDYFLPQSREGSIVESLRQRGWSCSNTTDTEDQVRVLPVARKDWLNVFTKGALDPKFWANEAPPTRPAFRWYLDLIAEEIENICGTDENSRVVLVGHSAGGWLARAALGYGSTSAFDEREEVLPLSVDIKKVLGLVTLGAPHFPPPPQIMDMTRGALRLTHETFPNNFHDPELFYITVMGEAIQGVKQEGKKPWEATTATGFAFNSYEAVCGDGTEVGDGVVPKCSGHLEGAQRIDLPGVLHSINAPSRWYGSTNIIDAWHTPMMESIDKVTRKSQASSSWTPFQLFGR